MLKSCDVFLRIFLPLSLMFNKLVFLCGCDNAVLPCNYGVDKLKEQQVMEINGNKLLFKSS